MKDIILITDPGSVDPDDVLTLTMLAQLETMGLTKTRGIITTHHYPEMRALLAKLIMSEFGHPEIPIYVGQGIPYNEKNEFDPKLREHFDEDNSGWPNIFGYPKNVKQEGEKPWFPDFMKSYFEEYNLENMQKNLKIEKEKGYIFLNNLLKNYSPENKLTVVSIAPIHDLILVDTELYPNMDLFTMGGGFEEENKEGKNYLNYEGQINMIKDGYNWGISPEKVQEFYKKVNESNIKINLITSSVVRQANISLPINIYNTWFKRMEHQISPKISKAIMKDWIYCNRGNKLADHKNLCDLLTLYLAVFPIMKPLNVSVNLEDKYGNYLNSNTLKMSNDPKLKMNTNVLTDFSNIGQNIVDLIEAKFCPYDLYKNNFIVTFEKTIYMLKQISKNIFDNKGELYKSFLQLSLNGLNFFCFDLDTLNKSKKEIAINSFKKDYLKINDDIVQIVGNCELFSEEGTFFAKSYLKSLLQPSDVIQYGFTGYKHKNQRDVNQLVSDIIDEQGFLSLANIVDFHTKKALSDWNCTISTCNKNFILAYNKENSVLFGDDIIFDDLCDKLILLEGGAQSFSQCVNNILASKPIHGLYGIMDYKNPKYFDKETKDYIKYFSACEFLSLFANKQALRYNLDDVQRIKDNYFNNRVLFNPKKGDSGTKQKLFEDSWNKFMKNELWKRVPKLFSYFKFIK